MKSSIYLIFFFSFGFPSLSIEAQDSLSLEDMRPYSYPFSIENNEFQGKGGAVLTEALANAHITMLGDNYRSKLESEFTNALILALNRQEYKTMVLETGIGLENTINQLTKIPSQTIANLKALNQQYHLERKGSEFTPIPDFKSMAAAEFLQTAAQNNWSFLSIGTASWSSYKLIVDELFNNLPTANQKIHQELYQNVSTFLDKNYAKVNGQINTELLAFTDVLKDSELFNEYLKAMANFSKNKPLIEALKFSLNYWHKYGKKEFFKKNELSSKRDKVALIKALKKKNFDFSKDKLFIKMWVNHLAKGTSVIGFFGVGNMLMEMADYHGQNSINIAIARRFYEENGETKDIMNAPSFKYVNFQELIPLGKKGEWILVDLRPFTEKFFYNPILLSAAMQKIIARYDFLVIPKIDSTSATNY